MNSYADVILPLPLPKPFTYKLSEEESKILEVGYRVAVSFGKRKIYTGIILEGAANCLLALTKLADVYKRQIFNNGKFTNNIYCSDWDWL